MGIFKKEMWPRWVVGAALFGLGVALSMVAFQECSEVDTAPSGDGGEEEDSKKSPRREVKNLVQGRLLDMKARPIAEADVEIYCANVSGLWPVGRESTDSQGRYEMEVCDRGLLHVLTEKRGFERGHLVRRVPPPSEKNDLSDDAGVPKALVQKISLPDIQVGLGVRVSGQVLDEAGSPVANTWVAAWPERRGKVTGGYWPHVVNTDDEGRFEVGGLRPRSYRFRFVAKGYVVSVRRDVAAPGPHLTVTLSATEELRGKVVFDGSPVAGAEVVVVGSGLWPARRVQTDAQGVFRFKGIPPGIYELSAGKGDLASRVLMGLEVGEEVQDQPVVLTLERGVRVQVRVSGKATGKPVARARVMLGHGALTVAARKGLSDDDGVVELQGVLPGSYFLSVEKYGFLPVVSRPVSVSEAEARAQARERAQKSAMDAGVGGRQGARAPGRDRPADGGGQGRADAETRRNKPPDLLQVVDVELPPGAELVGEVVDDVGEKVAGARLEVISSSRGVRGGRFSAGILDSRSSLFQLSLPESSPAGPSSAAGSAFSTSKVAPFFSHEPVGGLGSGGVMNLGVTGGPVPLTPLSGGWNTRRQTGAASRHAPAGGSATLHVEAGSFITDEEGRFRIRGLASGDLVVVVSHPDYARYESKALRLKKGEQRDGLRFVLKPGVTLVGEVTDAVKKPLQGVRVVASSVGDAYHGAVSVTDGKGRFEIRNLTKKVRLQFTNPGYVPLVTVVDMAVGVDVRKKKRIGVALDKANHRLEGHVVDKRDLPVTNATVEAVSLNPRAPHRMMARVDKTGRFFLDGLGKLDYLVQVYHRDRPTAEFRNLALDERHRLVVGYGGGLEGVIRDKQTRGFVNGVKITLEPKVGDALKRRFPSGRFRWKGLAAGRYEVLVRAPGYAPVRKSVVIPEGRGPQEITVKGLEWWLHMAGRVVGVVRDSRMMPVEGAKVWCEGKGYAGKSLAVVSSRQGKFVLVDRPPGRCTLHAFHPDRGSAKQKGVEVVSRRATLERVLELVKRGTGKQPKAPRAGVSVTLSTRGESVYISTVASTSTAAKAGVAAGDELLRVDGETVEGLGRSQIRALLQGPVGSTVILALFRGGKTLKVPVRREVLK